MPKYKTGDVLVLEGSTTGETFKILDINSTQYILQSSQGGAAFAIGIAFVDSNPKWHLASKMTKYLFIAGGILLAAMVLSRR